jgi:tetratricopeptide (TPR) repeat protein
VGRLIAFTVLLSCASVAEAQRGESAEVNTAVARRLYQEGLDAARASDFELAYEKFTASLELAPRAATLLNLAGVEVELGRYVEALEHYRAFLRERTSTVRRHRATVEAAIADLEPMIANVRISAPGILDEHLLLVDGNELPHAALGTEVPVNPGAHVIRVEDSEGRGLGMTEFDIASGEARQVLVRVVPIAPEVTEVVPEEEEEIYESPWFWAAVGGGTAAVIIVVISIAVATSGGSIDEPWPGNFDPTGPWTLE